MIEKFFALYYSSGSTQAHGDPDGSFLRAAKTWIDEVEHSRKRSKKLDRSEPTEAILLPFGTATDLEKMFRLLHSEAGEKKWTFVRGAIFTHSIDAVEGRGAGRITVPRLPTTLAELHHLEELKAQGFDTNMLGGDDLDRLPKLPWAKDATLSIVGCNSGIGKNSIAEQFAKSQKVHTIGEIGFCSFSQRETVLERITRQSPKVYLKAFFFNRNAVLALLGDENRVFAKPYAALPPRNFFPQQTAERK